MEDNKVFLKLFKLTNIQYFWKLCLPPLMLKAKTLLPFVDFSCDRVILILFVTFSAQDGCSCGRTNVNLDFLHHFRIPCFDSNRICFIFVLCF